MTHSIETSKGTFTVSLSTLEVPFFGTTYDSVIRKGKKIVAVIADLRQAGHGFAPDPFHNEIIGLTEHEAITLHKVAIKLQTK
jgi:hypothetical protein